jgi:hypothetical protein
VLCGQEHLSKEFDKNMKSEYNCYKLWGFDVFIDSDLKPWIIEVALIIGVPDTASYIRG